MTREKQSEIDFAMFNSIMDAVNRKPVERSKTVLSFALATLLSAQAETVLEAIDELRSLSASMEPMLYQLFDTAKQCTRCVDGDALH